MTTKRQEQMRAAKLLGTHTEAEWLAKYRRLGHVCTYCGGDNGNHGGRICKDHMIPVSRGGSDAIDNITPACVNCNNLKGDKTPEEFAAFLDARGVRMVIGHEVPKARPPKPAPVGKVIDGRVIYPALINPDYDPEHLATLAADATPRQLRREIRNTKARAHAEVSA